ncbi:AfsR/SARP family transcriptional regulator [Lentzea guizhouensis]|uniref:AfsR/SARP family transcriptional regulator n=1 Tax=Lentzea guizhouensis TaxID=1586287 RepID=UPI00147316BC|nr:tetratricopeptide repeat protein [Lentzea guizhouensis]
MLRLLGEVSAEVDGRLLDLGPPKQRCVLAALVVDAGHAVLVDRLVERVWGVNAPPRARATLHSYVSRLRRALEGVNGMSIACRSGSYSLLIETPESVVDLQRFRHLRARARDDEESAVFSLTEALALWRGEPLTGVDGEWVRAERERLSQERLSAEHELVDARLRAGAGAELVAELSARASRHPLDERVAGQYLVALHRAGRTTDALEHYRQVRACLVEELGIDPGAALQELHGQLLAADPRLVPTPATTAQSRSGTQQALTSTSTPVAPPADPADRVRALPHDVEDFTGRGSELDQLLVAAGETADTAMVIVAIDGMAGVGKTALAVHGAHRLANRYPDVQLYIDMHAHSTDLKPVEPAAALETLLRLIGVTGDRIPSGLEERAGLWRAELAGRRTLLVLDNVSSAAQVRPLLPGSAGCLALVTSRRRLTDLDAARTVSLEVLPHEQAVALFTKVLGDEVAEPAAVGEVVALCGHLPLALRIAGARLRSRPAWTAGHLVERLRAGRQRLRELVTGDRSVAAALHLSYRHLSESQRRLFRLLGLHPGVGFDVYPAAALAGVELLEAEQQLEELVDLHLLQEVEAGRYRMHDLVRTFAAEMAVENDGASTRATALARLQDSYLCTAAKAVDIVAPGGKRVEVLPDLPTPVLAGYDEAMEWLERERVNLVATATSTKGSRTSDLSTTLLRYFDLRGHHDDALVLHGHAYAIVSGSGDVDAECQALGNLGTAHERLGSYVEAEGHHRRTLDLARSAGALALEGRTHNNLGNVYLAVADHRNALVHYERALDIAVQTGNRIGRCRSANNLGIVHERLGRYDEAIAHHTDALALAEQDDDLAGRGYALHSLGFVFRRVARYADALEHLQQALTLAWKTGNRSLEGYTTLGMGLVLADLGRFAESVGNLDNALVIGLSTGNLGLQAEALNGLGHAAELSGDQARALAHHRQALDLAELTGDRYQLARAHDGIAHACVAVNQYEEAREHWCRALNLYVESGVPEAEAVRARLSTVNARSV